jgi:hypothetical protein
MTVPANSRPAVPNGLAFDLEDHVAIRHWALLHDYRSIVRLDHGADGEDYEEVVAFCFGWRSRCRFIIWRNAKSVFVQPLLGRTKEYASVVEALAGSVLNKPFAEHSYGRLPRYTEV